MLQTRNEERELDTERRIKFKGTARVSIESIYFERNRSHELDIRHVETLKDHFRANGCHRLEVRNHIPAIIDQQDLDVALEAAKTSAEELLNRPAKYYRELVFPVRSLECLHGRHRIEAGRDFLSPCDSWWTVDLYLRGKSDVLWSMLLAHIRSRRQR
jgi:hypothetical protein